MDPHPITGFRTIQLAGEDRILRFDLNACAVLSKELGEQWQEWLVLRFYGKPTAEGMHVEPMTGGDVAIAMHALLASDREDAPREETAATLRRTLKPGRLLDYQKWMLPVIYAGWDVPGELIEAVEKAADEPRTNAADGTGTKRLRSRSGHSALRQGPSGG